MKHTILILLSSIAVFAYVLTSRESEPDDERPATEVRGLAPPLGATGRGIDDESRLAHAAVDTSRAPAISSENRPARIVDELELAERLSVKFNSERDESSRPVEHEHIVQILRDDPEMARELAKDDAP